MDYSERTGQSARRISSIDTFSPYLKSIFQETTSYFLSNFPDYWGEEALRKIFIRYGTVRDVFIPRRVDRNGRRYGFMRYKDVRDKKDLEKKLDAIMIEERRLNVNLAKFSRFDEYQNVQRNHRLEDPKGNVQHNHQAVNYWEERMGNLRRKQQEAQEERIEKHENRGEPGVQLSRWEREENYGQKWKGLQYYSTSEDRESAKECYVGEVHNPSTLFMLQEYVGMEGYYTVKVTPMGGNLALLRAEDKEEIPALIKDAKDWLGQWFSVIRPWQPRDVNQERLIWLKCHGIPIHAWHPDFFKKTEDS